MRIRMSYDTYHITGSKSKYTLSWVLSLLLGFVIAFPLFFAFMAAFKTGQSFNTYPPKLLPDSFLYFDNFIYVLLESLVPRYMLNSLVTSLLATFVRLLFSTMAAYSFAFFTFRGKKFMFFLILGTMMIPPEALLISNYLTVSKLGFMNTYMGIMIVYFVSATQVFMFRQNFKTISTSLREAAFIDGCSDLMFYLKICLPVSKPIITSLGISSFVGVWNAYLWPLLITNRPNIRTVQVGITMLKSDDPNIGILFAGIAMILLPSILIFAFYQRNLVHGISSGAVKG